MSFGSGGFGGFGQNNQSTGFGGFGSTSNTTTTNTGFGSTNTFGSNAGTGLFGNSGGSGFGTSGGFGSSGTGAFGAKPAFGATTTAGGGLFGSTTATAGSSGFGSGGGFGSTTTGTSTFGGGGSGTGSSLFGSKPTFGTAGTTSGGLFGGSTTPATSFGSTTGGFGATANPGLGTNVGDPPGTATVPFQPFVEKEANGTQQNSFQNVLFMEPYRKWSAEELRLADYNQGRRYGNSTGTGAFGVGSNFGGFGSTNTTTNTSTGGLFGSSNTNTFGTQNTGTTGGFGSTNTTSGGLFGAKPAATGGGLFGSNNTQTTQTGGLFGSGTGTTTSGFGSTSTGGFGTANSTTSTGSLFGNTANKPATGFGFGTNNQTTTGFGNTGTTSAFGSNTTTNTGGGLFGNTNTNTTTTGGGLFGSGAATTNAFGASTTGAQAGQTGGLFGQAKPATGGLFGTATNNTTNTGTTGGGLFGNATTSSPFGTANNTQQTGGLFQQKPAVTTNTGGGLFGGGGLGQTGTATTGGLFGGLGQNTQQQQPQQTSLFGSSMAQNQQKPSLFGSTAPAAGGSLFGNAQPNQQAGGSLFGQTAPAVQQQGGLQNGSLFGNSLIGSAAGTPQGLTTSISDAGAYGAPSLFQNLAASEVHNPGPLATPLSGNKTKTSRRSSILPLYKMNPGSASKFATPQKRGYGFSYSAFGTPTSVSSTASTPAASMSQSLLAGSVGRGSLSKSISSSNLRRTYNAEDSILLPGAFSASSGPRYYGTTGGSKKLVINRDMRTDLFSTPTKSKDSGASDASSDSLAVSSGARKLTKRVSFDTSIAHDGTPENGRNGSEPDMGYLRPSSSRSTNGSTAASSSASNGNGSARTSSSNAEPEMEQVTGKELAIVHEEETSSPVTPRCIPENYRINNKELGEYWMSPSKEEIENMNRVQRQQVSNFTVGRTNVGQVRFRVPVDLSKINLDSIMGGIVTLIIRSATVYPDVHSKPPVGQGLNVPSEIMLLHTCPRSGPDVSAAKMKHHIQRLKNVPDTTFISYDDKTAAWTFAVEHFTTYGLDDEDETDGDVTAMSTDISDDDGAAATVVAGVSRASDPDDDTFDFRRRKRAFVPGAFDSAGDTLDDYDDEDETPHQSFLSNRSVDMSSLAVVPVETTEHDEDMELTQDDLLENEAEATHSLQHHPAAELQNTSFEDSPPFPDLAPAVPETPGGIMRARLRAIKESNTPLKVQVADGDNWMDMLQKTVSPQKRDRAALKAIHELDAAEQDAFAESTRNFNARATATASRSRMAQDNRGFATSIDLMNSLFEKAKAPPVPAPAAITTAKGFVKWPYKRQGKTVDNDLTPAEQAFRSSVKPTWSPDGTCIIAGEQGQDESEPVLKRARVFESIGSSIADDALDNLTEHKSAVDIKVVNGVPSVSTRRIPQLKLFAAVCEQANQRKAATASPLSLQLGSYERSVWELASVLFDPIEGSPEPAEAARTRKENLSRFWAHLVQDSSVKSLEQAQSLEEKAVVYLAGHKVPEACRALVDGKNLKAATLVSLIGTSDAFRKDMREQVDDWNQSDVLAEFNVPIRAVYSLLAGNVAVSEGKKGVGIENRVSSVVLSDYFNLDWKQAFGLRLWYGISVGEGVEVAVASYLEDLEQGRVPSPRPWYVNQPDVQLSWVDPQRELREDLLFGLLKVAAGVANLEDVLEPESSQPSPFSFRLGWQLNQALAATDFVGNNVRLPAQKADALTSAYAAEVVYESSRANKDSAWLHAIWVLLHLTDPTSRTQAIQDALGRQAGLLFGDGSNGPSAETSLYERLVEDLKIPASWVWQAAALYWRNQRTQPALEAECLLRASAYADAHRIFVKELAPKAIVERNYSEIAAMLGKLQPHRHQISEWSLGGEVYSWFLDLLTLQRGGTLSSGTGSGSGSGSGSSSSAPRTRGRQQQQAKAGAEQASVQLAGAVEVLVSSLPAMYDSSSDASPTEVAAITEMADVVAKETMALANKGRMDLAKISRLPLTEDRRVRYSTDLAFAYYREVMSAR